MTAGGSCRAMRSFAMTLSRVSLMSAWGYLKVAENTVSKTVLLVVTGLWPFRRTERTFADVI